MRELLPNIKKVDWVEKILMKWNLLLTCSQVIQVGQIESIDPLTHWCWHCADFFVDVDVDVVTMLWSCYHMIMEMRRQSWILTFLGFIPLVTETGGARGGLKVGVLELLESLVPVSCRQELIPPLLAGYTATLSPSDR